MVTAPAPQEVVPPTDFRRGLAADFAEIAMETWRYRELLFQLVLRDLKIRYKQAMFGFAWALLMPALTVFAGLLVKFVMATMQGRALQHADILALSVKAIPWSFFIGAIGFATPSLVQNTSIITKVYSPREVFPLAATVGQGVDSSIGALLLVPIALFLGCSWHTSLFWVPILALLLFLFTVAMGLLLSCANLFFRDVKYLVQVLLTFGIFFTPVLFEPAMLGARGATLIMLNPMSPFLEGLRLAVVSGHDLFQPLITTAANGARIVVWSPWYIGYGLLWSIGGLLGSSLLFHRLEFVFAEYV